MESKTFYPTGVYGPLNGRAESREFKRLDGGKHYILKTWPEYWEAMRRGLKTFEARREDDHKFEPGDTLDLAEWDPKEEQFTGRYLLKVVTYVLRGERFGIQEGHCVMAIVDNADGAEVVEQ